MKEVNRRENQHQTARLEIFRAEEEFLQDQTRDSTEEIFIIEDIFDDLPEASPTPTKGDEIDNSDSVPIRKETKEILIPNQTKPTIHCNCGILTREYTEEEIEDLFSTREPDSNKHIVILKEKLFKAHPEAPLHSHFFKHHKEDEVELIKTYDTLEELIESEIPSSYKTYHIKEVSKSDFDKVQGIPSRYKRRSSIWQTFKQLFRSRTK